MWKCDYYKSHVDPKKKWRNWRHWFIIVSTVVKIIKDDGYYNIIWLTFIKLVYSRNFNINISVIADFWFFFNFFLEYFIKLPLIYNLTFLGRGLMAYEDCGLEPWHDLEHKKPMGDKVPFCKGNFNSVNLWSWSQAPLLTYKR